MSFIIRVYGILINSKDEVLLSDERYLGREFTKFPGGGLEKGEGIKDCLIREFREELGIKITVEELIYLTDFYQPSAFNKEDQIFSVYYKVSTDHPELIKTTTHLYDFPSDVEKTENQRWKKRAELSVEDVTFPIDKLVVKQLLKQD